MTVLQINAVDSTSSTGTVMRDIQDMCLRNGIECHISYCETERSKNDVINGYRIGNVIDHRIHQVLSHLFNKQAYFSRIVTKRFLSYIGKVNPDVVHLHNLHNNFINLNMLLAYLAKKDIATVITLHDNWFFAGGCCLYEYLKCRNWETGCKNCPYDSIGINKLLPKTSPEIYADRKRYFGSIRRLVAVGVSDWMSAEASHSLLKGCEIRTVRNGVRMDVFQPLAPSARKEIRRRYGIDDSEFAILAPASKWLYGSNRKGLDIIIKGLKEDERLVIYGCKKEQMNLDFGSSKVTIIPFIKHKNVLANMYSMADVFINCTHMDTCSFINIESQSCGTPVITFDNTGAAETVDGKCGFRVPTDDFDAIILEIERVRQLKISPEQPRKWVESRFSMRENYNEYIEIYRSL